MKKNLDPMMFTVQKLDIFIDEFLLEMGNAPTRRTRKSIAHKVLLVFLGNYSCFADGEAHSKSKELMIHFSSSIDAIQRNERLDSAIQELVGHMSYAMNGTEEKEPIIRAIIFKLICMYAALAESDMTGAIKCHDLGKELSSTWKKSTPTMVTLSTLKKREKNSKLPINELELLERYSF